MNRAPGLQRGVADRAPDIGVAVAGEGGRRGLHPGARERAELGLLGPCAEAAPLPPPLHRHAARFKEAEVC